MIAYRQPIRPGDSGSDVTAVKRTMKRMGIKGASAMNGANVAGPAFIEVLDTVLRMHKQKSDHIYGPNAHAIIAPNFKAYDAYLYRTAKIRKPPEPDPPHGTAQEEAKLLLKLSAAGKYHADNPGDLADIQRTANGQPVWSQGGYWVHVDPRPLRLLVWLIENQGFEIGTFAICSDHHNDGPHGHAGGLATDISSINRTSIASPGARALTLKVAQLLHSHAGALTPRQLICDGYGYLHDWEISACTIPSAAFYGGTTMSQHRNHIHAGF